MDYTKRIKKLNQIFGKLLDECPWVVYIGDPLLRQKTTEVSLEEGINIGNRLKTILEKYRKVAGFGRGLAAPQIGEMKSVFVTYLDNAFKIYINPKITQSSADFNIYRESCLSCGYLSVDVKRSNTIEIEYMNEQGITKNEHVDSFSARLIQHEIDHLEGIVNIDKAENGSIDFMVNDPLKEQLRNAKY